MTLINTNLTRAGLFAVTLVLSNSTFSQDVISSANSPGWVPWKISAVMTSQDPSPFNWSEWKLGGITHLSEAQKQARQQKAEELYDEAMNLYNQNLNEEADATLVAAQALSSSLSR